MTQNAKATIDVRHVIPRERHPLLFSTFGHLDAGDALRLQSLGPASRP